MKKILLGLGLFLATAFSLIYVSKYNYLLTGISTVYLTGHTTAYLTDYKKFYNNSISKSAKPQPWPLHDLYNQFPTSNALEDYHKDRKTVAYLVIKSDSILYEKYYDGFGRDSKSNSFSRYRSPRTLSLTSQSSSTSASKSTR